MPDSIGNTLIITFDMIPYATTWGGAQRMFYLASYLKKEDVNVSVIACKKKKYNYYGNTVNFNLIHLPIRNLVLKNAFSNGNVMNKCKNSKPKAIYRLKKYILKGGRFSKILKVLDSIRYNESTSFSGLISKVWVIENEKLINQYIKDNKIENVLISGPPFGMFYLTNYLDRKNTKIILDYRDPWNFWGKPSRHTLKLEKKYLSKADFVTCTNKNMKASLCEDYGLKENVVHVIENGYYIDLDNNIRSKKTLNKDYMNISYVGNIAILHDSNDGFRNIEKLIKAFERCLSENIKIQLNFVGVNNIQDNFVNELKSKFKQNINFLGQVDKKKSIDYMNEADVLLLPHTAMDDSGKYIISGKFYDYLVARKYILSIGKSNSMHADLVESLGIGKNVKYSEKDIYNNLTKVYYKWKENKLLIKNIDISVYSRLYQYTKLIDVLREKA